MGIKPASVPAGLDHSLSLLKYGVLGLILYFTWKVDELIFRGFDPCYALISRHGEDITFWAYVVSGAVVLGSVFLTVPFCRWLCPLGAVLNPFSRFGATRVRRDGDVCIDCGKCAKACPMAIPVDRVQEVTHARCTSCLDCVEACPEGKAGALKLRIPGIPAHAPAAWSKAALVLVLLLALTVAVSASYLFPLPSFMWSRGEEPPKITTLDLKIENLNCRGNANLLVYFLERDDELEIPGYLRLEAWPGPGTAEARISFDPAAADPDMINMAVTEPYFDYVANIWRNSPFGIEGYDPFKKRPL